MAILDPGEINEIENLFRDTDARSLAFAQELTAKAKGWAEESSAKSYNQSVQYVIARHREIIEKLRAS